MCQNKISLKEAGLCYLIFSKMIQELESNKAKLLLLNKLKTSIEVLQKAGIPISEEVVNLIDDLTNHPFSSNRLSS